MRRIVGLAFAACAGSGLVHAAQAAPAYDIAAGWVAYAFIMALVAIALVVLAVPEDRIRVDVDRVR